MKRFEVGQRFVTSYFSDSYTRIELHVIKRTAKTITLRDAEYGTTYNSRIKTSNDDRFVTEETEVVYLSKKNIPCLYAYESVETRTEVKHGESVNGVYLDPSIEF